MATHSSILVWRIPMDRGAWRAIVHRVAKSGTGLKRMSMHAPTGGCVFGGLRIHCFHQTHGDLRICKS